jgi:hypothetical protein
VAPSERLPVIQGVLVAGADSQFFRLDWARSADSAWSPAPDPILAGEVALTVTGNGGTAPLLLRPGGFGVFVITMPIYPDSTYLLEGTVAGLPVSASTHLPKSFSIGALTGDTLKVDSAAMCAFGRCRVPLAITTEGAEDVVVNAFDTAGAPLVGTFLDGGELSLFVAYGAPGVAQLEFLARDENAARFGGFDDAKSSITGGFGVFGGALRLRAAVKIE